jgi:hypothetical protein
MVLLSGCGLVPVTDGFHRQLPSSSERIIVWGNHASTVSTATTWLQKRGLASVDQTGLHQMLDEKQLEEKHLRVRSLQDEAAILRAAKALGVGQVVFVHHIGDIRAPMVSIRSIQVETNQLLWGGSARFPGYHTRPLTEALTDLTCQALATAWGMRPPGEKWFASSEKMCGEEL